MINRACIAFFIALLLATQANALNLSMPTERYAESMEFYYKEPRPEMIAPMLRAFSEKGILANAEKRLFVAAFLAELIKKNDLSLLKLAGDARKLNRDAILTVAWAAHLSGHKGAIVESLLNQCGSTARKQIEKSPAKLREWNTDWEKSVLNMYWGAFMATGNVQWLDAIIGAALSWANNPRHPTGREAAAKLYDYVPGHALILERLREKYEKANATEKRMLKTIIDHADKK